MTSFFIPSAPGPSGEQAYNELRIQTELRMGRPPSRRRIMEIWTRRGKVDCITKVGAPDPISGDIVIAIFDMGSHQPFVIYRQHPDPRGADTCEVLGCNAYSISEFAP